MLFNFYCVAIINLFSAVSIKMPHSILATRLATNDLLMVRKAGLFL